MKKFWESNKYMQIAFYALIVIILSITFFRLSSNTDSFLPTIIVGVQFVINLLTPILYGFVIAYLINPIMCMVETLIGKKVKAKSPKQKGTIRHISLLIVYVSIIGLIYVMFLYLVPQLTQNLKDLYAQVPHYLQQTEQTIAKFKALSDLPIPYLSELPSLIDKIDTAQFVDFSNANWIFTSIITQLLSFISSLINLLTGLVIAYYVLVQKESFAFAWKRITYACLPKEKAEKTLEIVREAHETFINFFVGKFIDSLIIGILAFIGLWLLKNPYTLLLAVIIGVTNMIPYFGPIIGAIPAVGITLFSGVLPAFWVLVFVTGLQQFDGLILGPKILGDAIGLSPFWIISGIIVGGALWGPLGMFFASPIITVILRCCNTLLDRKLDKQGIVDLIAPQDTNKSNSDRKQKDH